MLFITILKYKIKLTFKILNNVFTKYFYRKRSKNKNDISQIELDQVELLSIDKKIVRNASRSEKDKNGKKIFFEFLTKSKLI